MSRNLLRGHPLGWPARPPQLFGRRTRVFLELAWGRLFGSRGPQGVSFPNLGVDGDFANQLFQYAMLRSLARRLDVPYACPPWDGDEWFELDEHRRDTAVPPHDRGKALRLRFGSSLDELERWARRFSHGWPALYGYPESERFFLHAETRRWFTVRREWRAVMDRRWAGIDFDRTTAVHLRRRDSPGFHHKAVPDRSYYLRALERLGSRRIMVFADLPQEARDLLGALPGLEVTWKDKPNPGLPERFRDYEDLYLMSRCANQVLAVSTFSWWAAWLNPRPGKQVVAPEPWWLPESPIQNPAIWCADWIRLPAAGGAAPAPPLTGAAR